MMPESCRPGAPEVCNGRDDDCDRNVDENLPMGVQCFGDAAGALDPVALDGVGNCRAGRLLCVDGEEVCDGLILPRPDDFCGGGDADCDGSIDEDGEAAEVCNGEDDDCDGRTDEDRVDERCDGVDNDCDGDVDEEWPALGGGCDVGMGECRREGTWVCSDDGSDAVCVGEEGAPLMAGPEEMERCDGLDNDCDGTIDDGFGTLGQACETGVGACRALGVQVCAADERRTVCDAHAGAPREEVCDPANADEDCDGVAEETCSCGLVDQRDVIADFGERTTILPAPVMPPDSGGLEGSCTEAGQLPGGSERDEVVVRWSPGEARLALISATSVEFDPLVYLRAPCVPSRDEGAQAEKGCALDSGTWGDDGRATMMVAVPEGVAEASVVVEAQGAAAPAGRFRVRVSDPTGASVEGAVAKRLFVGDEEFGGADRCRKRVARAGAGGAASFDVLEAEAEDAGWQERRFCIDNDGWQRSVEVPWDVLIDSEGRIGGVLLPEVAEEAGDWWSTEIPVAVPNDGDIEIRVDPLDPDRECAANSIRLVARVTCTVARVPETTNGECTPVANGLWCGDGADDLTCAPGIFDGRSVPRRVLSLADLHDRGCRRPEGGRLILHIGVIRQAGYPARGCGDAMNATCGGPDAPVPETVPSGDGLPYRLRVRVAD